ncbi:methyltransferase domain-containing protein [Streptosporangium sp. CA-115845]|uniref:methyltransferase domain-containing protein n=1 Tax=Streptosporangium sp. CA-115845 TaxID=3240071 RepID=UPI003D8AD3C1
MPAWESAWFRERAAVLAAHLAEHGVLDVRDYTSRLWASMVQEVPRHLFVPSRAYAAAYHPRTASRVIDRKDASTDWWNAIYTDCSIITQRDEGATDVTDLSGTPTCSLSAPSISLAFLNLLDLADHHRVLEIGTGTGWTAAALAWRLGDGQVTSIEVDEMLAESAARNLRKAGFAPRLLTGDGAAAPAAGGSYDRVHVTCGVRDIPYTWVEQTRPGGVIVAPFMPAPTADQGGQQLVLDVAADGSAIGRFTGPAGFMMLRSQRRPATTHPREDTAHSTTRFDPRTLADLRGERGGGLMLMLAALLADVVVDSRRTRCGDGWGHTTVLETLDGLSWAACEVAAGADAFEVTQSGPRRLWDELYGAYTEWLYAGKPQRSRFGITVFPGGQNLWLDHPDHTITWGGPRESNPRKRHAPPANA